MGKVGPHRPFAANRNRVAPDLLLAATRTHVRPIAPIPRTGSTVCATTKRAKVDQPGCADVERFLQEARVGLEDTAQHTQKLASSDGLHRNGDSGI